MRGPSAIAELFVVTKRVGTLVTTVSAVSVSGDHIMTEDGRSAIVVSVGENMGQLDVARFPADDRPGPGRGVVVVSNVARQSTILTHTHTHTHTSV